MCYFGFKFAYFFDVEVFLWGIGVAGSIVPGLQSFIVDDEGRVELSDFDHLVAVVDALH